MTVKEQLESRVPSVADIVFHFAAGFAIAALMFLFLYNVPRSLWGGHFVGLALAFSFIGRAGADRRVRTVLKKVLKSLEEQPTAS